MCWQGGVEVKIRQEYLCEEEVTVNSLRLPTRPPVRASLMFTDSPPRHLRTPSDVYQCLV
ncbi:hypothetical protein M011DRAFT_465134 [Sporormia fimetaria CBS 119925]|uniref:Uncharacterized protein n=1 Tax=Sporormia fimetaria CBS 119925 TaxID=1340428 RepID=A0A6A6VIB8_9PLEO|nr:hypothetical protein M011DRAFT_465134 [Sporormia fimetaria CBS 119925]